MLDALAGPVPDENAVTTPRATTGTNTKDAIASREHEWERPAPSGLPHGLSPSDPQTTGREGDEQRAHC